MKNLELITNLVKALGVKPDAVVKYWQDERLLSVQTKTPSLIPKNPPVSTDIKNRVKKIVAETTGRDVREITKDMLLREDLLLDSLDEVELIVNLEKEFKIELPDTEAKEVKSVRDLIQLVTNHA